jgi:hypothetical protein
VFRTIRGADSPCQALRERQLVDIEDELDETVAVSLCQPGEVFDETGARQVLSDDDVISGTEMRSGNGQAQQPGLHSDADGFSSQRPRECFMASTSTGRVMLRSWPRPG